MVGDDNQDWSVPGFEGRNVPQGTKINSDFVFYNPLIPEDRLAGWGGNNAWISVELTFDNPILAVIGNGDDLLASSALFGLDGVTYNPGPNLDLDTRGVDQRGYPGFPQNDLVRSIDGNMLSIYMNIAGGSQFPLFMIISGLLLQLIIRVVQVE